MKAAVQTRFGSPDVLRIADGIERPSVGPDQILVAVHASAVTQGDRRLRAADFPGIAKVIGRLMFGVFRPRNPTGGTMFAGRVVAVGDDVTRFAVGDDVFGSCDKGAWAEYLAVSADGPVAPIPAGFSYEEAAAVPYGAGTALAMLRDIARVQPGERVLVVGASGGVGRFAVQIAKHLGATVTGVSSGRNAELVRQLGADHVIDYESEDFTRSGQTYDVIFDTASGSGFRAARGSLAPGGRYVTLYLEVRVLLQMLWTGLFGSRKVKSGVVMGNRERTEDLARLLAEGAIRPVLAGDFSFDRIADAHAALEDPQFQGDIVVSVQRAERRASVPKLVAVA